MCLNLTLFNCIILTILELVSMLSKRNLLGILDPGLCSSNMLRKECNISLLFRDGQKQNYIFGTYQNGPVKNLNVYQGDLTAFMFTIEPYIRFMTTDRGDGGQNYFLINSADEKVTKKRKGIGFGGTN